VESGGELLLVTRPAWCGVSGDLLSVHRVDTVRNVLEPVSTIGNRALFLSRVRCVFIDADKFPAVQGGCIYFVDQLIKLLLRRAVLVHDRFSLPSRS